jgi:hypothetical protein
MSYVLKEALRKIANKAAPAPSIAAAEALEEFEADEKRDSDKHDALMEIGRGAYAALAEMVAALNCDFDRLEELKDERQALAGELKEAQDARDNCVVLSDSATDLDDARKALAEWDEENGEELKELTDAAGDCESQDDARQRIQEDPLSVEVRNGWRSLGDASGSGAEEFKILLSTGGPAVRIMGELDDGEVTRAYLQVQDWGTPWTDYTAADSDVLLAYCREFYFGE